MGYLTPTEVLNDLDKTFGAASTLVPVAHVITVSIPVVSGKKHYIGSIILTGTAGAGAAEAFQIKKGDAVVWQESFVVGTDLVRQFQAVPLVGNEGEAVSVVASATELTAGKLFVIYYTK